MPAASPALCCLSLCDSVSLSCTTCPPSTLSLLSRPTCGGDSPGLAAGAAGRQGAQRHGELPPRPPAHAQSGAQRGRRAVRERAGSGRESGGRDRGCTGMGTRTRARGSRRAPGRPRRSRSANTETSRRREKRPGRAAACAAPREAAPRGIRTAGKGGGRCSGHVERGGG